jgi:hypothetical protein
MYRFFEILPGALAWGTLALMIYLSWRAPVFVAVFIILFDVYWLLKTVYLYFHLRNTYIELRKNLAIPWRAKLDELPAGELRWQDVVHLVVLPMFREPHALVRETFLSLAKANYPHERIFVVLAIEERAGDAARETARRIEAEFGSAFGGLITTAHPADLPGELAGKGSNETWAVREAEQRLLAPRRIPAKQVMVSVFDVDTQVFPEYFGRLAYVFLTDENRWRAIYQPIPFFTNNIFQAPALARVIAFSSTFWQMMQQSRPERLTSFSSQAWPLQALQDIGYWRTDCVAEDSRGFWQGYLHFDGDFRCIPLVYPVSMDANVVPSFWKTMRNLYLQQRRWAWGAEDIPYLLDGFRARPRIPFQKKFYWGFNIVEGFHSWATNAILIFALGWLPVEIGGERFQLSLLSHNLPQITSFIINISMVGIATSAILSLLLLPAKPEWFRRRHYAWYFLEWLLVPVVLIVFGCIPALDAETRLMLGGKFKLGFWVTPKDRGPAYHAARQSGAGRR